MDFDFALGETSRTAPEDIDFERDHLKIATEFAEGGETVLSGSSGFIVCVFNGSASKCLLESYVSNHGKEIGTVARIFVVKGDENSKEIGLLENGGDTLKREILTVYSQNDLLLISVEQDQYGSAVIDQLLESEVLKSVLGNAANVFVFHTEPNSKFRSSRPSDSLYYVNSSGFQVSELLQTKLVRPLPMPNLVQHFSAAVLTHCEMVEIPCTLLVNYTEFGDSGSHIPFVALIRALPSLSSRLKIPQDFSLRTKANSTILYNSNLFI